MRIERPGVRTQELNPHGLGIRFVIAIAVAIGIMLALFASFASAEFKSYGGFVENNVGDGICTLRPSDPNVPLTADLWGVVLDQFKKRHTTLRVIQVYSRPDFVKGGVVILTEPMRLRRKSLTRTSPAGATTIYESVDGDIRAQTVLVSRVPLGYDRPANPTQVEFFHRNGGQR